MFMEFSRQEYWSGLSFPPPGDLPDPEIEPTSLVSPALAVGSLPLYHRGHGQDRSINYCFLCVQRVCPRDH